MCTNKPACFTSRFCITAFRHFVLPHSSFCIYLFSVLVSRTVFSAAWQADLVIISHGIFFFLELFGFGVIVLELPETCSS